MDSPKEPPPEKGPKASLEDASREDLIKQVKRQLTLLQKAKAKCDELSQKGLEKDKALVELQNQARKWEQDAQKWTQDREELETLRQAYQSLQDAQEKQFESFRLLQEQLDSSNEDLVMWRHKYTECLMSLECTESKMASYTQGTEFLQQEVQRLEAENRVASAKVVELSESHQQLQAERAALQQQLDERDELALQQRFTEVLSQCSSLRQERDACSAAREALAQQVENACEEADSLRHRVSALLQERSSLENQRDEKMNECNLLQEEKQGLESQVSDLYQMKEELEAKEKEFAKILDDHSSMEKLLTEAVNENTQLQESVNGLREELSRAVAEKQELARQLKSAEDSLLEQVQSSNRVVVELEERLAQQTEKQKELECELALSASQWTESEKRANNLKASLAQLPGSVEDGAEGVQLQELLRDYAALKEQVEVLEQEKEALVVANLELEEAAENLQAEKAVLKEELAIVRAADAGLLEKLETSAAKVSGLQKDLNTSLHEKQDIVDELMQVKDLQGFLEDEAKELHTEYEKLKMETARVEADLENDRLHIQKLEVELEAAECRDQDSLRELDVLRQKLKEMAVLAMKYEEAFRDCTVLNAESRMPAVLKAFHRISQLILEAAERMDVDIQVDGLLPGMGATLVFDDCSGDCKESWGEPGLDKESTVSVEAYDSLKKEIETVREQLQASNKSVDILQFEKQALEEDLGFEKRGREAMRSELVACEELIRSYERRIEALGSGLDARFSKLRDRINQKEGMLRERGVALRDALQDLAKVSEGYPELKNERDALQDLAKVSEGYPELKNERDTLLGRMHQLEDASSGTAQLSTSQEGQQWVDSRLGELEEFCGPVEPLEPLDSTSELDSHPRESEEFCRRFEPLEPLDSTGGLDTRPRESEEFCRPIEPLEPLDSTSELDSRPRESEEFCRPIEPLEPLDSTSELDSRPRESEEFCRRFEPLEPLDSTGELDSRPRESEEFCRPIEPLEPLDSTRELDSRLRESEEFCRRFEPLEPLDSTGELDSRLRESEEFCRPIEPLEPLDSTSELDIRPRESEEFCRPIEPLEPLDSTGELDSRPRESEEFCRLIEPLERPDCTDDFKPTECELSARTTRDFKRIGKQREVPESPRSDGAIEREVPESPRSDGLLPESPRSDGGIGREVPESPRSDELLTDQIDLYDVYPKSSAYELELEVERLQEVNRCLSKECSSLRAALDSSDDAVAELSSKLRALHEANSILRTSTYWEASKLQAELQERAQLLDEIHSKLDDQLEQCEGLEAMLADRDNEVRSYQDEVAKKDSELASLAQGLSCVKEQLASYEREHARLCAVFQPQTRREDSVQDDVLCEWYSAHRAVLGLLAQLVAHASNWKQQQHAPVSSDGNGDSSVLSEARCLWDTLSKKLESVASQEATSSLPWVITKAICSDVTAELALVKSLGQLLDSLLAGETKVCGEVPPSELDEEKLNSAAAQIASLQSTLQEREERLAKFKALVMKHKKELADKAKQMNAMERELAGTKQELEKQCQAAKQSVLNFQSLQDEYDRLQDQHESARAAGKEAEAKVARLEGDLVAAKHEVSEACLDRDKLKKRNDVLGAELAALTVCRDGQEKKLATLESQLGRTKERVDELTAQNKSLEEAVADGKRELAAKQAEHAATSAELDRQLKESKMHTLLDLEIADYERTVAELNNLLKERSEELENTRKESLAYQSKIANLVEHIGYLESQKKADDERMLAFKETVATLKEGLSKSRKHEEDLLQSEVRLESELKAAQLREQDLKLGYAEVSRKCQELESTFRTTKDNYQRAIKALESKVASLKEELGTSQVELQATKVEFENYKVRVHTVLKQQKKSTAGGVESADTPPEAQEKLQGAMEHMRQKVRDLTEQLELSQAEAESSRDEYDRLAQRHQAIAIELEAREAQWKRRLEDVIKQNSADMSVELDRQLQKQYEELSAKYQKRLAIQEQQHSKSLELHVETVEQLKREIAELQQRLPNRQGSPSHDEAIDITTLERQDGEGSESVSPVPPSIAKPSPWSLVPTGGFKPLEQLLHEDEELVVAEDLDALHAKVNDSQKKVDHLAELLNESESSNLRMTEQIRVLKEEIRRLERNQEREKHAQNLEYLKNVIMKFVTLRGGNEKERLVPVLTTMLKLSPDEKKDLEAVVTGEAQQDAAAASSWGGYLPRW